MVYSRAVAAAVAAAAGTDRLMTKMKAGAALFGAVILWTVATAPAAAAERSQLPRFADQTRVTLVEVPIQVIDGEGRPVRGLTADDFELFDDGRRQAITGLEVIDLDRPAASDGLAGEAPAASGRRHLLLVFDLSFSQPAAMVRARAAAREFVLHSLHPTDLAAVAVFTLETGPRLLVTFTPDRAQVARALDELSWRRLPQAYDSDPLRFLLGAPLDQPAQGVGGDLASGGRADAAMLEDLLAQRKQIEQAEKSIERGRISSWTRGLSELAGWLRSIEGRTQVMFFSEGIDTRLMLGRAPDLQTAETLEDQFNLRTGNLWLVDTDDMFGNISVQNAVGRMLDEFRRADAVIQAIDVAGLQARGDLAPRSSGSGRESLFHIARETGGALFENDNDFQRGLERMLSRSTLTYVLSFQPTRLDLDGAYHRLKVTLKRPAAPRVSLTYRNGYHAPRPFAELDPHEKALLASEAIAAAVPRADLEMEVLAAAFRAGPGAAYVPVIIEIGGEALLAGQQGDRLGVEIYAYVTDERGEMKDFFTQVVRLDLTRGREALAAGGLKYYGHLDLAPGRFLVRVLARNAETGRTGVVTVPLAVPELASGSTLLPPFFHDRPGRWLMVRESLAGGRQGTVVYPFTVKGEPYVPAARAELRVGEPAQLCLVAYNLGEAALEVEGSVLDASGRPAPAGQLVAVERSVTGISGLDKFVATLDPAGLAAGEYTLRVALVDPISGTRMDSAADFTVVPIVQ